MIPIIFQAITIPSINTGSIYLVILYIAIFFFAFLPVPIVVFAVWWATRVNVRLVIAKEKAGGTLKGVWRRARAIVKRGELPRIKISRMKEAKPMPPSNSIISLGRKDFALLLQDEAGDLKPFKIWTNREKLFRIVDLILAKSGDDEDKFKHYFSKYFIPSLTIDDADARYFKVLQDRETANIYADKWTRYQGLLVLGGILIMAVVFVVGTIFMQRACS